MKFLQKEHIMYASLELLILLTIIWICSKLSFLFSPVSTFFDSIFTPILISGILFYLLNPLVKILTKIHIKTHHLPRTCAVIIIFAVLLFIVYLAIIHLIPSLIQQVSNLVSNMPHLATHVESMAHHLSHYKLFKHLPIQQYIHSSQSYFMHHLKNILLHLSGGVNNVLSLATDVIINVVTIPFMLFYMLKDGSKLKPAIAKLLPVKHRQKSLKLLSKMSNTISHYIDGQLIECCFIGTFTSIGFFCVKQPYAILLGLFAGLCVIIPYVGPYIGITPAVMMAFSISMQQVIAVIVVTIIVQQIDGNVIYPNVIGKTLNIHPLTIIIILLAAGNIAGMLGMILAVPTYAIAKTVVLYAHHLYVLAREQ